MPHPPPDPVVLLAAVQRQLEARTASLVYRQGQLARAVALLKLVGKHLIDTRDESELLDEVGAFLKEMGD